MSEHEFEKFLALLSGMLKLDAGQRDEIAGELRDHLEDRLTELLAEGVPREKAILVALEEFGDAAGLAAEFLHIVRHQRRRRIMRLTAGSLAVMVAIVLGSMAFWPDSHPVQVTPRAVAEQPAPASTALVEATVEENNAVTECKLAKRIPAQFADIPLNDVLGFLFDATEVDYLIRTRKLEEGGISLENLVNLNLKQIRAEMLLDLVLGDAGLTYTVRDGIVIISSQDDPDVALEVRIYNVRDLVTMSAERSAISARSRASRYEAGSFGGGLGGGGGGFFQAAGADVPAGTPGVGAADAGGVKQPAATSGGRSAAAGGTAPGRPAPAVPVPSSDGRLVEDFEPLIDLLKVTVEPNMWDDVGGNGSVMQYDDGLLVINQSPQVHKKISNLLEKLRELRGKNAAASSEPAKPKK